MTILVSKKTSRREYLIQKKLHAIVPKFVPKPESFSRGIMKTKKYGVSVKRWLSTHACSNRVISQIIRNVRLILNKIRRKYPGFRHMDLHIGNVLFYKGRVMLIDFGLSRMNAPGVCPCRDTNTFIKSLRKFMMSKKQRQTRIFKKDESAASIAKRLVLGSRFKA